MKTIPLNKIPLLSCMLVVILSGCNVGYGQTVMKQGPPVPMSFCISSNEMELYRMVNDYRKDHNLTPVPLSKSLSYVAALHARDLYLHHPDQGSCNFHSWSNKGSWTPFCYPKDETKKNSVWDKPRELTRYPSKGYEIVYWENSSLVKDTIFMVWKMEEYFNDFLLNTGKWQGKSWNAIGIAVYENYACAWFGEVQDPEGEAIVCGSKPVKKIQDTVKNVVKPAVKPVVKPKKPKAGKTVINKTDSLEANQADTATLKGAKPERIKESPHSAVSPDSALAVYYIIVKTNLSREAADKLVISLKAAEYPDAKVLTKDSKIRVSVFESTDKAAVMTRLKEVKKTYKDAWLLKK